MKHTPEHCKDCYIPFKGRPEEGCKAFNDRRTPLINDEGMCQGRITTAEEWDKLISSLR